MLPVLVVGELNVDIVLSGLAGPPQLGREMVAEEMRMVLGSASAIFASGMARLGHAVDFVSKVGEDDTGRFCRQALEKSGVSTAHVMISALPTGATVVLSTREDRALVTHLGAIADLRYGDVPKGIFAGHSHLHLTSYFLQTGLRPDFARLARQARGAGLSVSFDPNSDPDQRWDEAIWEVIEAASVLFVNEPEALGLTGKENLEDALDGLGRRTALAVVKRGRQGAVAVRGAERFACPGFAVEVADTTGAGDSFAAGFVHGMLTGLDLRACLAMGNAAGALSAMAVGGTAGQPDRAQLEAFLRRR